MVENIGIVGGGQLGRMLTEAALPLGFNVTVLDPTPSCPASKVGARQIVGGLRDIDAIDELVAQSDVTTWEIEHIDSNALTECAIEGADIQPDPTSLTIIQDKVGQKGMLQSNGLPVAKFAHFSNQAILERIKSTIGAELIIKSPIGGYDGRGNLRYNGQTFQELKVALGGSYLYAEELIDFERELAVIAARDRAGKIVLYPTVETIHENNICHMTLTPARVDKNVDQAAQEVAHETLKLLGGAGVFAIEMFQVDGSVIINEIAPRVHNSGHFTIEATETSQFEQHVRAITGMPLGSTRMITPAAVMINILGNRNEPLRRDGLERVLNLPDTHPHFYGKNPRPARKVGHITVLASSVKEAEKRALLARKGLVI